MQSEGQRAAVPAHQWAFKMNNQGARQRPGVAIGLSPQEGALSSRLHKGLCSLGLSFHQRRGLQQILCRQLAQPQVPLPCWADWITSTMGSRFFKTLV